MGCVLSMSVICCSAFERGYCLAPGIRYCHRVVVCDGWVAGSVHECTLQQEMVRDNDGLTVDIAAMVLVVFVAVGSAILL